MCSPTRSPPAATCFYDPWAPQQTQHSPKETEAILDLLAVDNLIDSNAPLPEEHSLHLLNDLLEVDLEFNKADNRIHHNVITAPELSDQRDVFLDLLSVDQEVDHDRRKKTSSLDQHFSSTTDLCDPYVPRARAMIHPFTGVYAANNDGVGKASEEQQLRDNAILLHLLSVDESVDNSKRWNTFVESDSYAILEDLYEVDREVSGAKRRETLVEDLQALWDVDTLMNAVRM